MQGYHPEAGILWRFVATSVLFIACVLVGYAIYRQWPTDYITVAILNVGKGTALYIESPTHRRFLIDGGLDHTILGQLRKLVPFYTRSLDGVILTSAHDQSIGGLIDIARAYKIRVVLEGATTSTTLYNQFSQELVHRAVLTIPAVIGDTVYLGGGAHLAVVYSAIQGAHDNASKDTVSRVMLKLTFGSSTVLVTAGEPAPFEDYVLAKDGTSSLAADILTTFYDSAQNTPSDNFLHAVHPRWLIVSTGSKKATEIPALSSTKNYTVLTTAQYGAIIFHCSKQSCVLVSPPVEKNYLH